ncbi:MAG: N-acyl homoserine lactonase family protein [Acidobacteria bacterium]|nr:N-acyl homoserine lactonase family protein [Acidobacteriota bacterium]
MTLWRITGLVALAAAASAGCGRPGVENPPATPRLYVLDGGVLASDPARYRLTEAEVQATPLSIAAYLVAHPRGVLLWDAGAVADEERRSLPSGAEYRVTRADGAERVVTLGPALEEQLRASGYAPAEITRLALSHYHWDHTANANAFAHATWLVRQGDLDAMFADPAPGAARPATYAALKGSQTTIVTADEHDVFGDGSVILKSAPGHSEGHQVLYVKLAKAGGVVLSGDLYHYPEERTLNRLPTFEVSEEQTAASRRALEAFLMRTAAALWIQHDLAGHRKLRKAPEYYD